MKKFSEMKPAQRLRVAKEFVENNQASTEPCKFNVRLNGKHLEFFSINDEAFYATEQVVIFAQFYGASFYAMYLDGKVTFIVY